MPVREADCSQRNAPASRATTRTPWLRVPVLGRVAAAANSARSVEHRLRSAPAETLEASESRSVVTHSHPDSIATAACQASAMRSPLVYADCSRRTKIAQCRRAFSKARLSIQLPFQILPSRCPVEMGATSTVPGGSPMGGRMGLSRSSHGQTPRRSDSSALERGREGLRYCARSRACDPLELRA